MAPGGGTEGGAGRRRGAGERALRRTLAPGGQLPAGPALAASAGPGPRDLSHLNWLNGVGNRPLRRRASVAELPRLPIR